MSFGATLGHVVAAGKCRLVEKRASEREGRNAIDFNAVLAPLHLILRKCVIGHERGSEGFTLGETLLSNRLLVLSLTGRY